MSIITCESHHNDIIHVRPSFNIFNSHLIQRFDENEWHHLTLVLRETRSDEIYDFTIQTNIKYKI